MMVIERTLGEAAGHHHTQVGALLSMAGNRNLKFLTGHNQAFTFPGAEIFCRLSTRQDMKADTKSAIERDIAVVREIAHHTISENQALILVPTARTYDLLLALELVRSRVRDSCIYLRVLSIEVIQNFPSHRFSELLMHVKMGSISFLTECSELSDLIRNSFGIPVLGELLLPCSFPSIPEIPQRVHSDANARPFRIGFMGQPRREKGTAVVPEILCCLRNHLSTMKAERAIEFVFQPPKRWNKFQAIQYVFRLKMFELDRKTKFSNLRMSSLSPYLNSRAFVDEMTSLDALLLPYEMPAYAARGSGMIIDAVSLGLPIVLKSGIGMSELRSFGNAEEANSAEEFSQEIMKMYLRPKSYRSGCLAAHVSLRERMKITTQLFRAILDSTPALPNSNS
jgi:hypothetical protein